MTSFQYGYSCHSIVSIRVYSYMLWCCGMGSLATCETIWFTIPIRKIRRGSHSTPILLQWLDAREVYPNITRESPSFLSDLHKSGVHYKLHRQWLMLNARAVNPEAFFQCSIMCQNACKMHHSESKNPKLFWVPPKTPPGEGDTPLKPHPLSACGASIDLPPNESPGSASGWWWWLVMVLWQLLHYNRA